MRTVEEIRTEIKNLDVEIAALSAAKAVMLRLALEHEETKRQRDELADAGHALGFLAWRSERYNRDADYREAADAMLAALRKAGRM